jgi:hypothetical protein
MTEKAERKTARAQELRLLATAKPSLWKWGKRVFSNATRSRLRRLVIWDARIRAKPCRLPYHGKSCPFPRSIPAVVMLPGELSSLCRHYSCDSTCDAIITHEEEKWGFIPPCFKSDFEGHGHAYPTPSRLACERSGIPSNLMGAIVLL